MQTITIGKRALLGFVALTGLAACGGGGDGASDLSIPGMTVAASELQIGHPAKLSLEIQSERDETNVGVQVFLLNKAQYGDGTPCVDGNNDPIACADGSDGDDGKRLLVGSASFETIRAGINNYDAEILIPYTEPRTDPALEFCDAKSGDDSGRACSSNADCQNGDGECGAFEPAVLFQPLSPGEYYLFAEIDPADVIAEVNEDNNSQLGEGFANADLVIDVSDAKAAMVNVVLESLVIDIQSPLLEVLDPIEPPEPDFCGNVPDPANPADNIPNVENTSIGITALVTATGSFGALTPSNTPTPIPFVKVEAAIEHPELPQGYPLKFWNSTTEVYEDALYIEDVEPGRTTAVHLDQKLDIEELEPLLMQAKECRDNPSLANCRPIVAQLQELRTRFGPCLEGGSIAGVDVPARFVDFIQCLAQIQLKVTLTALDGDFNEIDEFEPAGLDLGDDFSVDLMLSTEPPEPSSPEPASGFDFDASFEEGFDGPVVAVGLRGAAAAGIDGQRGAFVDLEVGMPMRLFRQEFDFMSLQGSGRALPKDDRSGFGVDLDVLGFNVYTLNTDSRACEDTGGVSLREWAVGGATCPTQAGKDCFKYSTMADRELNPARKKELEEMFRECLKDCWAFGAGESVTADFVVGVVPLTASFFAAGTIGFQVSAGAPCDPDNPAAEFIASAGPWANLTMDVSAGVGNSKAFAVGAGGILILIEDTLYATAEFDLTLDSTRLVATLRQDITNTLKGPSGKLYLYVGYPCISVCRKWGIPYPCGYRQCKQTRDVASFVTFTKEDVIFCRENTGSVDLL